MKTVRIRTFTIICLLLMFILPWTFFVASHYMENRTFRLSESRSHEQKVQQQLDEMIGRIEAGTESWIDPAWQRELKDKLQAVEMDAVLLSASGEELFRSDPDRRDTSSSTERFSIIVNGELHGKAIIYLPSSNMSLIRSIFAGLILAFFVMGAAMRRLLLKPLEKMSVAARQIAEGDWDVELPRSGITEISEVRDGFAVMVKGLQNSFQKQAQLEKERRFVISAVAHDLRTPLFALRGYLDGLEQGIARSPEQISKYVAVCKQKSEQLGLLVEDLFTFTKLDYLEAKLSMEEVDVKLVMERAVDSLRPLAEHNQMVINSQLAGPCMISGDAHLLERAMNNLLDNAVRHTPSGGAIEVRCSQDDDRVVFEIRDAGSGFSTEDLERAFEPLYRGETSRSRATGGSGLGLTISQRIIRRHGGDLTAANHPEGGAILRGWFPERHPGNALGLIETALDGDRV